MSDRPARRRLALLRRRGSAALAALAALAWLGACNRAPAPPGKLSVVASAFPIEELTRKVAGDRAAVVSLVPPGVEPHDWEPSPQDVGTVRRAALFVYNGGGLEPWAPRILPEGSGPRAVRATEGIALATDSAPGPADRGEPRTDPHVWLDPVLARKMVENIRDALERADPAHAAAYRDNARAFDAELRALDRRYAEGLDRCARREVVASHAAFGYLARRYGLTLVPIMGLAPEAEPTPGALAKVARFAKERKVKYIFYETLVGPRLAETLAREVGAQTLVFNPIEGVTAEERAAGKGYLALMDENLQHLRLALDCR